MRPLELVLTVALRRAAIVAMLMHRVYHRSPAYLWQVAAVAASRSVAAAGPVLAVVAAVAALTAAVSLGVALLAVAGC